MSTGGMTVGVPVIDSIAIAIVKKRGWGRVLRLTTCLVPFLATGFAALLATLANGALDRAHCNVGAALL